MGAVAQVKQIAQHWHAVALLPLAQQRCHWHAHQLPEQVQQRALECGECVYGDPQVKGLVAAPAAVAVRKAASNIAQYRVVVADFSPQQQVASAF